MATASSSPSGASETTNESHQMAPPSSVKGTKRSNAAHSTPKDSFFEVPSSESSPPAARSPGPDVIDKNNWQGFCEIESEPAYFSTILRDMGVDGVSVREVFTVDPQYLRDSLPQPIYGLILLFHYREFGNADQPAECPQNVWFANQLPAQNSCATLAMINILMNSEGVKLGEHLDQFKDFTHDFTPFQRGEALASFDFVKRIHNSFAKKMDILESDKLLSHRVVKAQRLKTQGPTGPPKKKGAKSLRQASVDSTKTADSAESHEETGHHFIAFVPVGNEVWKLDGLDAQPTSMGMFNPDQGETWLSAVSDTIAILMAAGDDDYGIVALTKSPLVSLRKQACTTFNTMKLLDTQLCQSNPDWKSPLAHDTNAGVPDLYLLGINDLLPLYPPNPLDTQHTTHHPTSLSQENYFKHLLDQLNHIAANIAVEVQVEAEELQKATLRRFDSGPAIKKWLEMLAENGHLENHLHRFMPKTAGRRERG